MTFAFNDSFVDLLCFVSPRVLNRKDNCYLETHKLVNCINWNVKSWGRYYIDDYYDLAYSLRLDYNVLETIPHECAKEIECSVDYYADLFIPIINVCKDKASYKETKEYIDAIWGGDNVLPV